MRCRETAHLHEDVGGVQIPVADALAVHVLHAASDTLHGSHQGLPVATHVLLAEQPPRQKPPQRAPIAVLLYTSPCLSPTCASKCCNVKLTMRPRKQGVLQARTNHNGTAFFHTTPAGEGP